MNASLSHDYQRVYVWEQPVRWFHWINAGAILVLMVSGWLIAHPPAFLTSAEASDGYWFGTVRFAHFAMGYVFAANLAFRIYWAFAGNKFASWRNFLPLTRAQLRQVWDVIQVDILQRRNEPVHALGHNAVAYFTYAGTLFLSLFQIVSGFALYAPTSDFWFPALFLWIVPLFGSEQNLRIFHYAITWAFALFTFVHVYLVVYHDYVEGHGGLSSIIGGWKFMEKHRANAEQATGLSAVVTSRPPASHAEPIAPKPAAES